MPFVDDDDQQFTAPNTAPAPYSGPGPDDDMGGGGYTPEMGDYNTYKANRRAYRSTFNPNDPNGWRGRRNENENLQIAAALRNNPSLAHGAGWNQLLASLGIHNQKDMRQSRYKSLGMARDGSLILDTNYHLDGNGNYMDVATSDVDPNSPTSRYRPQSLAGNPNLAGQAANPFVDQLDAGFANVFQRTQRGNEAMLRDPATGLLFNDGPGGRTYYDDRGYRIEGGQRRGHYGRPGATLGSLMG